ncbi:MAG: RNA polymerase sigma factor [Planctomycetota bacterium]|jgi:RNA polymerase sigma-70 factor (ECF subfamily)
MENTDKSLIDAHCRGDREAFAELVRRYGGSVLGYLRKVSGRPDLAEDLFQETFRRVHEKAHTLRGNQFKPWLFKIATRVAIDGVRRRNRLKVVSLNRQSDCTEGGCQTGNTVALADNWCEPSTEAIRAEQREQVRRAIDSLPERQRTTLVLAYYQQLSYPEVAQVLGCSVGTVKMQMYRALRTLAGKLPDVSGGTQ